MDKKVLIISTSLRQNSNSEALADALFRGARDGGNTVEKISLYDKTIGFCRGCLACQKTGRCVIHDDADTIAQRMSIADVLVFATPVYYYEMSGQLKTMLDRANPLYPTDYAFRDIYLLSAAAEDAEGVDARAISGLEGWIECFPKARLSGTIFAGGVAGAGEIAGHPALTKAYEMGKSI